MVKQYIILRKDAKTVDGGTVSPQKLAVMAAHASMAFLATMVEDNAIRNEDGSYSISLHMDGNVMEHWFGGSFTKVLLSAKNLRHLNKAIENAKAIGLKEGEDFFPIRDSCRTELIPDEGTDTCFIGIGFRPMEEDRIREVTRKYQLYH